MRQSQHVLRGLYSCQNGIFVLILPAPELGKISTLVVGKISTIGTRLWKHIQISISNQIIPNVSTQIVQLHQ